MSPMAMADDAATTVADGGSVPPTQHNTSGMPCCGMSCPGALPAALPDVVRPQAPTSLCLSVTQQDVADNAPARLYRPPISLI